jgi:hypothetical protein
MSLSWPWLLVAVDRGVRSRLGTERGPALGTLSSLVTALNAVQQRRKLALSKSASGQTI